MPKDENINVDEILANAGVKTVAAAPPPSKTPEPPKTEPQGGAFLAGDGRMLYRYTIEGETRVFPKPIEEMTEEDFYALPMSMSFAELNRVPQMLTVKFKDPQWVGHWFNRKAGDGRSVSRARTLGYVPAKIEDCEWVSHGLSDEDGAIIDNDLVLMKIHKATLFMQQKVWMDLAKLKGSQNLYKKEAEGMVGARGGSKVSYYHTPQAEEFHGVGPVTHIPTIS